ncbi:hypothetical protein KKG36_03030 [Patescibacteria group bacterium]|nr:hypothetical protein [Patescibacteria group bacterium]
MNGTNFSAVYAGLVKSLPEKTREVFARRFGIQRKEKETLESIGQSMDVTRERIRQIQDAGFNYIKSEKKGVLDKIFRDFLAFFKNKGGIAREDIILQDLGGSKDQSYVAFFLAMGDQFSRVCEKKNFYSYWTTLPGGEMAVKKTLDSLALNLKQEAKPVAKKDFLIQFAKKEGITSAALVSYLDISKNIKENKEGLVGLIDWPQINPKGVRDKAYLVFRKETKPLHFTQVASLIDRFNYNLPNKKTLPQTVHNELIKDSRFVLVGRGMYALKEWGYNPGTVKDVIIDILGGQPLAKDVLVEKVLSQRIVAKNTVLMNLNDKKSFARDEKGRYILRKTETA